jgi:5-methylcytosine-specific restriction endonuclease McrA
MTQTVVLNADFTYLNTVGIRKAIKLLVKEKAEVIAEGDRQLTEAIKVPLVLRLVYLVKTVYKNKVPYSRKNVLIRDKHTCQYCGAKKNLTIDHVIPVCQGGKSEFKNCVAACFECNNKKGHRTLRQAGMSLRKRPHEPTIMDFLVIKMKFLGVEKTLKDLGVF